MYVDIAYKNLVISPDNVRTVSTDKAADKAFVANIKALGLLQNLVVKKTAKKGIFDVVAGARRYAAIGLLIDAGHYSRGDEFHCKVKEDGNVTLSSLSENICRASMHPADEFLAFQKMVDDGLSVEEIAENFGTTVKHVNLRLKLARVAPKIINQYKAGKTTLDVVMAFSIEDCQDKQMACFKDLSRGHMSPWQVRERLVGDRTKSTSAIVKFVGLSNYKKAGGAVLSDLFNSVVYIEDRELISTLAESKLVKQSQAIDSEGWRWVEHSIEGKKVNSEYLSLQPKVSNVPAKIEKRFQSLTNQLAAMEKEGEDNEWSDELWNKSIKVEEKLEETSIQRAKYFDFSDKQKRQSGCIVTFDVDGQSLLLRGLVKPEDVKKKKDGGDGANGSGDPVDEVSATGGSYSQALTNDLGVYRQQVVKAAVASNMEVAFDVMLYSLCRDVLSGSWGNHVMDARILSVSDTTALDDLADTTAGEELAKARSKLNVEWLSVEDGGEGFTALRALPKKDKNALLAYCVADALRITAGGGVSERLVADLDIPFAKSWQPTRANYFGRVTKPLLMQHGESWNGADWKQAHAKDKKSTLVELFDDLFNGDASGLSDELISIRENWLPRGFATTTNEGEKLAL